MPFRLAAATLALCASAVGAQGDEMTCEQAVLLLGRVDRACPRACSEEGSDGLRQCDPGERERTPQSCGMYANDGQCRLFLASFNDTTLDSMVTALSSCTGDYADYAQYAAMGDYFKLMVLQFTAEDCGLSDSLLVTMPAASTCLGGASVTVYAMDRYCPRQCNEGGDDDLPECAAGQEERAPDTCGTMECGRVLAALDDDTFDEAIEGLSACATDPDVRWQGLAVYASMMNGEYLKGYIRSVAADCGQGDRLALAPPALDTCAGAYMLVQGFGSACPKQCEDEPDEDSGLRQCFGDPEYSPQSCGLSRCQNMLANTKAEMDELRTGLRMCMYEEGLEGLASAADTMEYHVRHISEQCGFTAVSDVTSDDVGDVPSDAPTAGARCLQGSPDAMGAARRLGWEPRPCM